MKKIFLALFFYSSTFSILAKKTNIDGSWIDESYQKNNSVPIHIFTLDIIESGIGISGEYCYISNYGNRIDCENEIKGKKVNKNKYIVSFDSSFGGRFGKAELNLENNGDLLWKIVELPKGGDFTIPKVAKLKKQNSEIKYYVIKKNKSFIFKDPSYSSKTNSYLIKGDKVAVDEQEGKWIKIKYKNKILGWIYLSDVN